MAQFRKVLTPLLATAITLFALFSWSRSQFEVHVQALDGARKDVQSKLTSSWFIEELRRKLLNAIANQVIAENQGNLFQAKVHQTHFHMYLHPSPELVSDAIRQDGHWRDCVKYHYASLQRLLADPSRPKLVVDVGGNIGSCSLMFGAMGARVVAFEPVEKNFRLFAASIRSNINAGILNEVGEKSIRLFPVAVADAESVKTIYSENGNNGNSIIAGSTTENGVDSELEGEDRFSRDSIITVRLSDFVQERVGLLKMDCQGYEPLVLRGMKELIERHGVDQINFEFEPSMARLAGTNVTEILWTLSKSGYTLVRVAENQILHPSEFASFEATFPTVGYSGEDLIAYSNKVVETIPLQ
ncbi:S-adenosyl-L-methionine-dependent methyltransferase [Cladochytrium replicatum]|nr:S-adenosyl-L-methionine-dependent methyltransferase [Cladochytrium replicatum]